MNMNNMNRELCVFGSVAVNPASINAAAVGTTDVTVAGLTTDMILLGNCVGALEAGLVPQGVSIPSANTLRVRLYNPSAGAVDGASLTWHYLAFKPRPS